MKNTSWILIVILALTACASPASSNTPLPTVVLDPSGVQNAGQPETPAVQGAVSASAEAVPVSMVSLSFPLTGLVKSVEVETGEAVRSGDVVATLDTALLEARVAEAQANVAAQETRVRYLRRVGPGDEQLNAAIADVDRANAVLAQMQATLAQATLTSPIDGTAAVVDMAAGETAIPGRIMVVVADLTEFQFETTDLSERDVASVQIGQAVTVFIEALKGEFSGRVTDVARTSGIVGGDVVYKVTIALDEQPEGLRWGMSADVTIQVEE